jgi:hypothetical protein
VLGNSIFSNVHLGIDLFEIGMPYCEASPNDPDDSDTGVNNLQNFPEITWARRDAGALRITYQIPSYPADPNFPQFYAGYSTYPIRVEFFQADADGQEGQTFLGFDTFTADDFAAGGKTATFVAAAPIKVFDKIVATATDSLAPADGNGPANTSEFSPAITIASPWQNRNPDRLRWDVTNDTFVSADDVVDVINYINAKGSGQLPDDAANEKPYYDVDGDNNVVAADVIDVINYINAGRPLGGEAEATNQSGGDSLAAGQQKPIAETSAADVMTLLAADVAAQAARKRKA